MSSVVPRSSEGLTAAEFRELADGLSVVVFETDMQGNLTFSNRTGYELFGYRPDQMDQGFNVLDHVVDEDRPAVVANIRRILAGESTGANRYRVRRRDGQVFTVLIHSRAMRRDGAIVGLRGIVMDITDRDQLAADLNESQARYQAIVEAFDGLIYICSPDFRVEFANRRLAARANGDPVGRLCYEALHKLDAPCTWCVNDRVFRGETVRWEVKSPLDGRWYDVVNTPLRHPDGSMSKMAMIVDVTEKRQAEEESVRRERLESLGTLAGGLAHDFNNILTGVLGNLSLFREAMPGLPDGMVELIREAEHASLRAKSLTQQLLAFAKGGAPIRQTTILNGLVRETAEFALRGSSSRAECELAADLWPASVDAGQVSQVVHNLVLNAGQAMPGGGIVRVRTRNRRLPGDSGLPLPSGPYIEIQVSDTGVGIAGSQLTRIFDPYFTTKQKGSGLGLSTAYAVVRRHGGHVTVASEPGHGAVFTVYLPAVPDEREPPVSAPVETAVAARGRILVMDDESLVASLAVRVLQQAGYEAKAVSDGAAAIQVYRAAREMGAPFDVVVLDLTVPGGVGGLETIEQLHRLDPGVCAIVSSGYSTDAVMGDYAAHGFCGVVPKPYRKEDLVRAVRQALALRPSGA